MKNLETTTTVATVEEAEQPKRKNRPSGLTYKCSLCGSLHHNRRTHFKTHGAVQLPPAQQQAIVTLYGADGKPAVLAGATQPATTSLIVLASR